jgi:hypothetical protein
VENKSLKPSFALLVTIVLIGVLFIYTYSIVQSNIFQSNLNKLKYMNLQANIHFDYVKDYIENHNDQQIQNLQLSDDRFNLSIGLQSENGSTNYYVIIEAKDDIPIRLSEMIIK